MSSKEKKSSPPKNTQSKNQNQGYKTKPNLSSGYCDTTFKNALRNADPNAGHGETLMVNPNIKKSIRQRREQISHVFSNEPPKEERKPHKKINYVPDNVMFNDDYVENNPKINKEKKVRYLKEKEWKANDKQLYSDELNIGKERQKLMDRKIKENYGTNPIEILSDQQNKDLNRIQREKNINHTKAYNKILGSGNLESTLDGMKIYGKDSDGIGGKITNNNPNINDEAKNINKNDLPNFGRKKFGVAGYGGGVFGYM